MSTSYIETVRSALDTELSTIIAGATYRNTVAEVYQQYTPDAIPVRPAITILFGEMRLDPKNEKWSLYDVFIPFALACFIQANTDTSAASNLIAAQDSLVHDIFRVITSLYTKNINSTPKWNIRSDPPVKVSPIFPTEGNTGEFAITGEIHLRNLSGSFSA
jgi:hypothetical protein